MDLLSVILEVQGWVVGEVLPRDHYLLAVFGNIFVMEFFTTNGSVNTNSPLNI
jgi:hypothetical protein